MTWECQSLLLKTMGFQLVYLYFVTSSLFNNIFIGFTSEDTDDDDDYTAPLLHDIELLSEMLGEVVKLENERTHEVTID